MHPKFGERVAATYLHKYNNYGYVAAKLWFDKFVPPEHKEEVKKSIVKLTPTRGAK